MNLVDFRDAAKHGLSALRRQPAERLGYWNVPRPNTDTAASPSAGFKADASYFQLSLAEMFLRDRREYWTEFLPFVLVVCDFLYYGQRCTAPVFAGKDVLQGLEMHLEKEADRKPKLAF